jgi:hypothetical protein
MKFGPHSGNVLLDHGSREIMRREIAAAGATYVKCMYPEHKRADLQYFASMGLGIVYRAPGEGYPNHEDGLAMVREGADLVQWIEAGNEWHPDHRYPTWEQAGWNHCWFTENFFRHCAGPAHAAGARICNGGWRGNDEVWQPRGDDGQLVTLPGELVARFKQVYRELDGQAQHAYGLYDLEQPQVERLKRWAAEFPSPLLLTEVGIAANDLIDTPSDPARYARSRAIKGQRLGTFAAKVFEQIPQAECYLVFISSSSTSEWGYFNPGTGYVQDGSLGYWLGVDGWYQMGKTIRERRAA